MIATLIGLNSHFIRTQSRFGHKINLDECILQFDEYIDAFGTRKKLWLSIHLLSQNDFSRFEN